MSCQERLDVLDAAGLIYWPPRGRIPQYKRYLGVSKGNPIQDIIGDIRPIGSRIGCDIAILAVRLIREVPVQRYQRVEGEHFEVDGIPVNTEQAQELFKKNPFQFEHWIVERVGAFPTQKTGDRGIDGRLYFETHQGLRAMVMSVKGGTVRPTDVRDLRGVLEREPDTEMAGFLSIREPTKAMKTEAAEAGQYTYNDVAYDRIQFLTAKDILEDGRMFETPTRLGSKIATGQASLKL